MVNKLGDMRIQQMTFMILFVFIFFSIAGLFFLSIQSTKINQNYNTLQKESATASIETIANMPELNCDSDTTLCLDEDKIASFATISRSYKDFWPVASIKVMKVYPKMLKDKPCPAANCSYYVVYDSNQSNVQEYGTFVNICKAVKIEGVVQEVCELGRLNVGVKIKG